MERKVEEKEERERQKTFSSVQHECVCGCLPSHDCYYAIKAQIARNVVGFSQGPNRGTGLNFVKASCEEKSEEKK